MKTNTNQETTMDPTNRARFLAAVRSFDLELQNATDNGVLDALCPDTLGGPDAINAMCDCVDELAKLDAQPESSSGETEAAMIMMDARLADMNIRT